MIVFLYLIISVLLIILLTSRFKINPAASLIIGSIFLGLILKMEFFRVIYLIIEGMWNSIKGIGLIILFSCIIGQLLKESNSIKNFGNLILINLKNKSLLSLNFLGLFIGTVVFCDSAFLILNGISKSIASSSALSLNSLNLSLSGGLYASHNLIPPTPGPMAAINNFNLIDKIGTIMTLGIIVSIPSSLISFFFAKNLISNHNFIDSNKVRNLDKPHNLAYLSIIVPLLLISLNTLTNLVSKDQLFFIYDYIKFIGNPITALFLGVLLSYFIPRNERDDIKIFKNSFYDFLPIILLTSMGSAFGNVIKNSELNQIPNISIDKKKYNKNFFNRNSKKISKPVVQPVLDEIIEGPQGYAAIINGKFVISGDMVLGFQVSKIEKNRVVLSNNGKRKILKRN